jgi:hypothetical protein
MKHCLLVFAAVVALAIGVPASAQYMYVDTNGDGRWSAALDQIGPGASTVDVWLATNADSMGTAVVCPTGEALTINSYTFILNAPSGGITYGSWTDNMGFTINANPFPNGVGVAGNDIWVAKASGTPSAPGRYKLGSLAITRTGGCTTTLEFHTSSTIDGSAMTSFGSQCPAQDFDNTMKLGSDWFHNRGTVGCTPVTETTWGKIKANYSH